MSHCPQPKTCPVCAKPVPPRRPIYCSKRCNDLASQRRVLARAKAAGADAMCLIRELRAETPPGVCPHCDGVLPPSRNGRPRKRCDSRECLRLYHRDYAAARRAPLETPRGDA